MLLEDEKYVVKWLSQYGTLPRKQIVQMLQKPPDTAKKIINNLKRQLRISEIGDGYYLALDPMSKPDQKVILAVRVLLNILTKWNLWHITGCLSVSDIFSERYYRI